MTHGSSQRNFIRVNAVHTTMSCVSRRSVALAVIALWMGACGPMMPSTPPSTSLAPTGSVSVPLISPTVPPTVTDTAIGMSFERPTTWTLWQPNQHDPTTSGPMFYVSTDPLLPTCATAPGASPNPPDANGMACAWPLTSLSPDGVLIAGYTTRILVPLPSGGEVIHMNGDTARLQIARPGGCAAIGGDESMDVVVPIGMRAPWSNVGMFACLRGPHIAASEMQVRAMFASVMGLR